MYCCMRNSVTKNSLTRLGVWTNQYHIDEYASGNCFLKVMTRESGLETKSTTTFIHQTLTTLDERMKSYGDDVLKFNTYVKGLIRSLHERGEQTYDLLIHLKKGYLACKDSAFTKYITDLYQRDEDDESSDLTPDLLMVRAANKYKSLVQSGQWKKPTEVERELMALRAEVRQSHKQGLPKDNNANESTKSHTNTTKPKYTKILYKKWMHRPKWLKEYERPSKLNMPRSFERVPFWYCCEENGGHCKGVQTRHRPSMCKADQYGKCRFSGGDKTKLATTQDQPKDDNKNTNKKKKVQIAAQAMVIPSPDDDSGDE